MKNNERAYFMEIIGDDPEFIEEVLVGCKVCDHRALTPTVTKARVWILDHHLEMEHGGLNTAVDLIGEQQNHRLSFTPARTDKKTRTKPQDRWGAVSEALGAAGGTVTIREVRDLLGLSTQTAMNLLTEWVEDGRLEVCSFQKKQNHYCRAGDIEANEEYKLLKLLSNGPVSKPKICKSLGYTKLNLRINGMVDKLIEEGKVESQGTGAHLKFRLITEV